MTEKELSQLGLLDEFSITELEQRLEFEAWCDGNCDCDNDSCGPADGGCVPVDAYCNPPIDGSCPPMPIDGTCSPTIIPET
jgi:hypothetical protein